MDWASATKLGRTNITSLRIAGSTLLHSRQLGLLLAVGDALLKVDQLLQGCGALPDGGRRDRLVVYLKRH